MSYQVIARKYRPQRFQDVVGQDHVTRTLSNAIEQNRIAHAYLFVGPRGTGKTTTARIFAKCLNCTGGPKVDFDEKDPRCEEIAEGRSLDVLEIDGASNRGIEEIRELRETVKYAPASSKFKIYIIDEVHMLTKEAFNALLKTLEEPPAHVKFMFATTEPEKVLPTILSRCQRFDLRRIPVPLIAQHLTLIAKQEKVEIEEAALHAIARGAEGGMRDAESALDQLISFCGERIVESDVLAMFGLTARAQILELAGKLIQGDAPGLLRELNQLAGQGKDLGRLLAELLQHFRNLLIFQLTQGNLTLLEITEAEAGALQHQAPSASPEALTRIMEILTDAEGRFRDAASKKIFLEVTLLRAMQARQSVPIDSILKELRQLRGSDGGQRASTAAPTGTASSKSSRPLAAAPATRKPDPPVTSSRSSSSAPEARSASADAGVATPPSQLADSGAPGNELETLWSQLIDAAGRASPFNRSYFMEAHPVSFEKGVLTIGFDPEFADHLELVNNQRTHALLQTKLQELGHARCQIKFIQADRPAGRPIAERESHQALEPSDKTAPTLPRPRPASASPNPANAAASPINTPAEAPRKIDLEEFKKDPLIQKALEIFKGQIVEVRG